MIREYVLKPIQEFIYIKKARKRFENKEYFDDYVAPSLNDVLSILNSHNVLSDNKKLFNPLSNNDVRGIVLSVVEDILHFQTLADFVNEQHAPNPSSVLANNGIDQTVVHHAITSVVCKKVIKSDSFDSSYQVGSEEFYKQIFEDLYQAYRQNVQESLKDRYITQVLHKVHPHKQKFLETVLENQIRYLNNYSTRIFNPLTATNKGQERIILDVIVSVVRKMRLDRFFGFQPMQSPVGMVFILKRDMENKQMEIVRDTVEAATRKLKVKFGLEAAQDAMSLYDVDVIGQITEMLSDEIISEFETMLFDMVIEDASSSSVTFDKNNTDTIDQEINKNRLAKDSGVVRNRIVMNPETYNKIYHDSKDATTLTLTVERDNNTVWITRSIPEDVVVIGYNNEKSEADSGIVFSPYVMLMMTQPSVNSETFAPEVNLMTRYATYVNDIGYYHVINLK